MVICLQFVVEERIRRCCSYSWVGYIVAHVGRSSWNYFFGRGCKGTKLTRHGIELAGW